MIDRLLLHAAGAAGCVLIFGFTAARYLLRKAAG